MSNNYSYLNSNFAERIQSKYKLVDSKIMKSLIDSTKSVNSMSHIQIPTTPYLQNDHNRYLENYKKVPTAIIKLNSSYSNKSIYEKFDELKKKDIQQKFDSAQNYRRNSVSNDTQNQPVVNEFFKLSNKPNNNRNAYSAKKEEDSSCYKNSVSMYLNRNEFELEKNSHRKKPQATI